MIIKKCEICGVTSKEKRIINSKKFKKFLCNRHYRHLQFYGKILKRTSFDKNKIKTVGNICYMELYDKNRKVIAITKFDKKYIKIIEQRYWYLIKGRNTSYATSNEKKYKNNRLHRLIMEDKLKKWLVVDHINMDGLNNLESNLRVTTNQQNILNNNAKNYTYNKQHKKWKVRLSINGKDTHIGYYNTEEEAKQIANKKKLERYK